MWLMWSSLVEVGVDWTLRQAERQLSGQAV